MSGPSGTGRPADGEPSPSFSLRFYREFPSIPEAGTGLPRSARSREEESGKFVILARAEEIHLVLSPVAFTPYHADIVRQYLQVEGRGRVEGASASGCRILSPEWSVHGGGFFSIQHWLHHVRLYGKSSAFGRFDASMLDRFLDEVPGRLSLAGYTVGME
jgi:Janus/Ocnus family (Ocnus)